MSKMVFKNFHFTCAKTSTIYGTSVYFLMLAFKEAVYNVQKTTLIVNSPRVILKQINPFSPLAGILEDDASVWLNDFPQIFTITLEALLLGQLFIFRTIFEPRASSSFITKAVPF